MEPLLSICIPTYNRCGALKQSLEQYVKCYGFDDSVEIVISDNASTDETEKISNVFCAQYKNIKYFRNNENVRDTNFELALRRGTGRYLKLQNDTTLFDDNAFIYMKDCIASSENDKPIFFTNDFIFTRFKGQELIIADSFDEYIDVISTYVTAISCFGVWKHQLNEIKNFTKYTQLMLNQDDWTYQLIEKYCGCTFFNKHYYNTLPKKYGGYHWFQVHLDNYYKILQPYVDNGLVSKKTLKKDKKNLLNHFLPELKMIYIYPLNKWKFEKKGTFKLLWKYYHEEWYFYLLLCSYPILLVILNPIHYFQLIIKRLCKRLRFKFIDVSASTIWLV